MLARGGTQSRVPSVADSAGITVQDHRAEGSAHFSDARGDLKRRGLRRVWWAAASREL